MFIRVWRFYQTDAKAEEIVPGLDAIEESIINSAHVERYEAGPDYMRDDDHFETTRIWMVSGDVLLCDLSEADFTLTIMLDGTSITDA